MKGVPRSILLLVLISLVSWAGAQPERIMRELGLDLDKVTIPLDEIFSGGPPPQGIPALGFGGLEGVAGSTQAPQFIPRRTRLPGCNPVNR